MTGDDHGRQGDTGDTAQNVWTADGTTDQSRQVYQWNRHTTLIEKVTPPVDDAQ